MQEIVPVSCGCDGTQISSLTEEAKAIDFACWL